MGTVNLSKQKFVGILFIILVLQVIAAFYFGTQKQGFHFDEYYSYYSSNVTYGLVPTDEEWKSTDEIKSEFAVNEDARFSYGMVTLMQSYDVHPPLYYHVLHTVCSLTPGIFSKWQGLSVNLLFFVLSWLVLVKLADILSGSNQRVVISTVLLFGFSPAVLSGITFLRMYMMLTFFCFWMLYIHFKAIKAGQQKLFSFYIPVLVVTFLGFLTHYYFIIFLFFLGTYTFFKMLLRKEQRKLIPCYVASVAAGMLSAVMAYPSCLAHMFRGYRGTEATQAFFDMSNLGMRVSFFAQLINDYVFSGVFYLILIVLLLLFITWRYSRTRTKAPNDTTSVIIPVQKECAILLIWLVGGYFLVVAKTALLNAEEAIRYEMPVYGLLFLLVVFVLFFFLESFGGEGNRKLFKAVFVAIIGVILCAEFVGLCTNKVLFLYPEDTANYQWAEEHSDEAIVYVYNDNNRWMIWDDSKELMEYEEIYFINMEHDTLKEDSRLTSAPRLYVYAVRSEESERVLRNLMKCNENFSSCEKIRELLYCDLYEIK